MSKEERVRAQQEWRKSPGNKEKERQAQKCRRIKPENKTKKQLQDQEYRSTPGHKEKQRSYMQVYTKGNKFRDSRLRRLYPSSEPKAPTS